MAWIVYFWLVAALLLLPLPFKIFEYLTGKDSSPAIVKAEEMINAAFFSVGLVGLYGFAYHEQLLTPFFWRAWVIVAIILSLSGLLWSPKLKYGLEVMGKQKVRFALVAGTAFLLPMLVGIWRYSAAA